MKFNLSDTFNKELTADAIASNSRRQVLDAAFSFVTPKSQKHLNLFMCLMKWLRH